MNSKERMNRAYIDSRLSGIFEPMVSSLLAEKPNDMVDFMIKYLKENYGNRPSINANERMELEYLKDQVQRMKNQSGASTQEEDRGSEDESDVSDEDEYVDDLPIEQIQKKGKDMRTSVSAEAFGVHNKKGDFKPPSYPKTDQVKDQIRKRLAEAFMFSALSEEELQIVIMAMQQVKLKPGQKAIEQGGDGDNLYVVESGTLVCSRVFPGTTEDKKLKEYKPGEAFGELALLYNAPRAATITASTDCELWSLDRSTFNHIVKDAAAKKREQYEEFLKKVKILSNMEPYERVKLSDAIKEEHFKTDEFVIREGDEGNTFYLVMKGDAVATKTIEPGKPA